MFKCNRKVSRKIEHTSIVARAFNITMPPVSESSSSQAGPSFLSIFQWLTGHALRCWRIFRNRVCSSPQLISREYIDSKYIARFVTLPNESLALLYDIPIHTRINAQLLSSYILHLTMEHDLE